MEQSRRSFLKTSGLLASGLAFGSMPLLKACAREPQRNIYGLQLYTLRDVIEEDPVGIIRQVAEYGYREIESYEGPLGMFWGLSNTDFRQLMDDTGMTMISSHANVFDETERKIEEMAEIGVKYIVSPYIGGQDTLDDYREIADRFNEVGELAREAGMSFAYHNHAYTFEELEGEIPQAVLMDRTDPDLVEYQMDIYWVVAGGADPEEWLQRYPGRFTTCHVKDLTNGDEPRSTTLGTGEIGFGHLLPIAREHGMEHFIVEQEAYGDLTPLEAVEANARFMDELDYTAPASEAEESVGY